MVFLQNWTGSWVLPSFYIYTIYLQQQVLNKKLFQVGAVNADEHRSLGGQFQVQGFPTIKIFGLNKRKPEDFNGQRTAQGLFSAQFTYFLL